MPGCRVCPHISVKLDNHFVKQLYIFVVKAKHLGAPGESAKQEKGEVLNSEENRGDDGKVGKGRTSAEESIRPSSLHKQTREWGIKSDREKGGLPCIV